MLVAVFATQMLGVFSGQGFAEGVSSMSQQLLIQLTGVFVTLIYIAMVTCLIFKVMALLPKGLRLTEDQQAEGLDIVSHEERGNDLGRSACC